jgi:hypothetical protein
MRSLDAVQLLADGTKRAAYTSTIDCIRQLNRAHGLKGFYRGGLANTYRATGGALCMAFYDTIQDWFKL